MIEVNLSNNLLPENDITFINSELGIKPAIHYQGPKYFAENDNCFSKVWNFFKLNHLNEHFDINQKESENKKVCSDVNVAILQHGLARRSM